MFDEHRLHKCYCMYICACKCRCSESRVACLFFIDFKLGLLHDYKLPIFFNLTCLMSNILTSLPNNTDARWKLEKLPSSNLIASFRVSSFLFCFFFTRNFSIINSDEYIRLSFRFFDIWTIFKLIT